MGLCNLKKYLGGLCSGYGQKGTRCHTILVPWKTQILSPEHMVGDTCFNSVELHMTKLTKNTCGDSKTVTHWAWDLKSGGTVRASV